jgi:DMSO/TMAO reductase YedYZ molybdopterin-dependent catalytic subunit
MTKPSLSRRDLFRLGLVAGPATLAASCGWQGGPLMPKLGALSLFNDWVGEKILLRGNHLAPVYPESKRTPPNLFPAYAQTNPLPEPDEDWSLEIGGLVRKPTELTLEMIQALPRITYTVKHHCVEGWSAIATWTGVPLSSVINMVEPKPEAKYLRFDTFDNDYYNGWDLKSAMHPQTLLAYSFNGAPLGPAHGGPLRVYSPIKLGYKLTKYLTSLTFTAEKPGGFWEDQGYPWLGGV